MTLLRKFSAPMIDSTNVNHLEYLNSNAASKRVEPIGARSTASSTDIQSVVSSRYITAKAKAANKHIEDRYKCAICSNPFSDPRVLDCLHTFCFSCLSNLDANGASAAHHPAGDDKSERVVGRADSTEEVPEFSELDLVTGTGKSSESMIPKSFSITSSIETVDAARDRIPPRMNVHLKNADRKATNRKSFSKSLRGRISTTSAISYTENTKPIMCPTCFAVTIIPVGGMNRLPPNFVVKRKVNAALLQLGHDLHTTVWCTLCFNETLAIACCLICNTNLCTFCKEAHVRQRSTSLHDVRYLNDLRTNYQQMSEAGISTCGKVAHKSIKCTIHPMHELKLFCIGCQQVACSNCTVLLHRGHKCEPILKAAKVYVKMVRTSLERTRPLTDYASDAISKLNTYTKTVNRRADVVQREVDTFLDGYLAALEVHRRTLHTQIIRARESKLQAISVHQSDLAKRCTDARHAIQFAEDILATGHDTEILTFCSVMLKRFEHCQRSRDSLDPRASDALTFLPEIRAPSTKDQHSIPLYGIITTQTAAPKFCSVATEGLLQLRVHRKVEVIMTSGDADGRPLCHGGLMVDVTLKYRDAMGRIVPTKVADRRDGTYVISFLPDAAGAMVMTVMVQGKHVKGSPFALCARTLRPHSGIFHCCTFCSSRGSKTTVCACNSQMVGGYKGCGHGHDGHPGRRHWSCCGSDLEASECSATNAFR